MVKCLPEMQETRVQSLGWEDLLEKEMATHSSTLDQKIPWMEEFFFLFFFSLSLLLALTLVFILEFSPFLFFFFCLLFLSLPPFPFLFFHPFPLFTSSSPCLPCPSFLPSLFLPHSGAITLRINLITVCLSLTFSLRSPSCLHWF